MKLEAACLAWALVILAILSTILTLSQQGRQALPGEPTTRLELRVSRCAHRVYSGSVYDLYYFLRTILIVLRRQSSRMEQLPSYGILPGVRPGIQTVQYPTNSVIQDKVLLKLGFTSTGHAGMTLHLGDFTQAGRNHSQPTNPWLGTVTRMFLTPP
jgi:hypothetical protein